MPKPRDPSTAGVDDAAHDAVFKALADPTRRAILDRLRRGPATTGELAERVDHLSRFGVMKHLDVLRDAGLVVTRPRGRERVNALNAVPIRQVYERWVSRFADLWSAELLRVREAAEEEST